MYFHIVFPCEHEKAGLLRLELLASDASSIEGGRPFSAKPHGWGISASAVSVARSAATNWYPATATGVEVRFVSPPDPPAVHQIGTPYLDQRIEVADLHQSGFAGGRLPTDSVERVNALGYAAAQLGSTRKQMTVARLRHQGHHPDQTSGRATWKPSRTHLKNRPRTDLHDRCPADRFATP